MTVLGPVPAEALGVTLMHEHILNDCTCWWNRPSEPERQYLATEPVSIGLIGELRMDPFVNLHNCALDEEELAIEELDAFAELGGRTVVDPTCRGIGRDPEALVRISRATGLHIVMGAGYYLQSSHPPEVGTMSADAIADQIVAEALEGIDGVRIGLIGEIGVSSDFTQNEEKSLRGAARAQARTGLPLMVHLPGWFRHGHRVLDVVEEEGGELATRCSAT
jgi:phosphotriesterase-related protein